MLHISYRRFCSVQCTAHRERERYLGWYGTAQPRQEYSGVGCAVRQAWRARGRATVTLTALSVFGVSVWRTLDAYKMMPRQTQTTGRAQASAQPRSEHRRASPAGTPRVSDSRLQPHHPVARSHKTRRRTTAHTTRAHRGSSVRCLHAQATSPSLRRSARASSKSLARY